MLNLHTLANPILRACDNLRDLYHMVLMGEEPVSKRTTFGLFVSADGLDWRALPEDSTKNA
jgi:hypothetical protein